MHCAIDFVRYWQNAPCVRILGRSLTFLHLPVPQTTHPSVHIVVLAPWSLDCSAGAIPFSSSIFPLLYRIKLSAFACDSKSIFGRLQAHRLGGDSGLRHGRSQRARAVWHRLQDIQRLCLRHGRRAYHQSEVSRQRPTSLLGERHPLPPRV